MTASIKTVNKSIHDWPVGRLHPYWARKPINLVQALIEEYSAPGDLVLDPFAGSGTTLFAATLAGRKGVGTDTNFLSKLIIDGINAIAKLSDSDFAFLEVFFESVSDTAKDWFTLPGYGTLERQRFSVAGDFAFGKYTLVPKETVYINKLGKKTRVKDSLFTKELDFGNYNNSPINFELTHLKPNSRIAIPKGARLSHYFTPENIATINLCLTEIKSPKYSQIEKQVLHFLLSSAIPLIRLSDKKASSQWPYWRPKENLTSRSALVVLRQRITSIKKAAKYLDTEIPKSAEKNTGLPISIFQCSAEEIRQSFFENGQVDLILTDPPYADQVPFDDYSSMWQKILSTSKPSTTNNDIGNWTKETSGGEFGKLLANTLIPSIRLLKTDGFLVWFYQERWTRNWAELLKTFQAEGLVIHKIIPFAKQRRSMKSVTSAGRTLDGDLIIVWKKQASPIAKQSSKISFASLQKKTLKISGLYPRYIFFLKAALNEPWFNEFSQKYPDMFKFLS